MTIRINGATAKLAPHLGRQPVTRTAVTKTAQGLLATARHAFTVLGLSAVIVLFTLYMRPDMARDVANWMAPEEVVAQVTAPDLTELMEVPEAPASATAQADATPLTAEEKAMLGNKKQQQFVTSWLSKRYRVAGDVGGYELQQLYRATLPICWSRPPISRHATSRSTRC